MCECESRHIIYASVAVTNTVLTCNPLGYVSISARLSLCFISARVLVLVLEGI